MTEHQEESATAKKTISVHKKKLESRAYPTILELYKFSLTTSDIRSLSQFLSNRILCPFLHFLENRLVCVAEVRQTRITQECIRLRTLLSQDDDICATARREKERLSPCLTLCSICWYFPLLWKAPKRRKFYCWRSWKIEIISGHQWPGSISASAKQGYSCVSARWEFLDFPLYLLVSLLLLSLLLFSLMLL